MYKILSFDGYQWLGLICIMLMVNTSFLVHCASVTATADVSGCSVWVCGTCDAKASSYLGSGRMTEIIKLALYTEVLGPWDSDCAGGRLLSTDTGLADLLPLGVHLKYTSALSTISSYGSISIYLSSIVTNEDKTWYVSFYLLLANSMTAFNNQQYRRFPSIFREE